MEDRKTVNFYPAAFFNSFNLQVSVEKSQQQLGILI